jgi:hypothetical protein
MIFMDDIKYLELVGKMYVDDLTFNIDFDNIKLVTLKIDINNIKKSDHLSKKSFDIIDVNDNENNKLF